MDNDVQLRIPQPGANEDFAVWIGVKNVYEVFARADTECPDRVAMTWISSGQFGAPDLVYTYAEMRKEIARAANALRRLGAERGDVVAYMLPSLPETQFILWGAETAAIAFPLNPLLQANELASLCDAASVKVLVSLGPRPETGAWEKALSVRQLMSKPPVVVAVEPMSDPSTQVLSFNSLMAECSDSLEFTDLPRLESTAAFFHTGGTTGAPKLVKHSHKNQLAGAFGGARNAAIATNDVMMNGLPMFHVASTIFCSLGIFAAQAQVLILSPSGFRDPSVVPRIWKIVEERGVTIAGGVPTALAAMSLVPVGNADISLVRMAISGASSIPNSVAQDVERVLGKPLREVYGMTECGGVICVDPATESRVLGSAGMPIPYCEVQSRKVGHSGLVESACAAGETGVLVVRGPNVCPGYSDDIQSAKLFTSDGWLITGDVGHVAPDGRVFITGRAKDLIIRSGHNIDPASIEESILKHPDVAEAAAVGMPDAYAGELPVVYVRLKPGASATADDLLNFARTAIVEPPAMPRRIFVVESIPQTAVGKVFKPQLRIDCAERLIGELLVHQPVQRIKVRDESTGARVVQITLEKVIGEERDAAQIAVRNTLKGHLFTVEFVGRWV